MGKKHREQCTLIYPKHRLQPEDTMDFIEMDGFARDWKRLGLTKADLLAVRVMIMSGPEHHPVIPGTGGLRKMRFAPAKWRTGKSGAARICFVYLQEWSLTLLVGAYSKNQKDDLTPAECREYRNVIAKIKKSLAEKAIK